MYIHTQRVRERPFGTFVYYLNLPLLFFSINIRISPSKIAHSKCKKLYQFKEHLPLLKNLRPRVRDAWRVSQVPDLTWNDTLSIKHLALLLMHLSLSAGDS